MRDIIIKIIAAILYVGVIVTNYLANALPINNIATGEVSDKYANLFAPAGITFSIWGMIYILLGLYILYQFGAFKKIKYKKEKELIRRININFIITSIANILWIFAWHYDYIGLSVIIMITLLIFLIRIANILRKQKFNTKEYILVKLPFSIYFGWITIATIANITTYLVSINWDGFGIPDNIWMIIILLIGTTIGIIRTMKDKNIAYALVFIWAYTGIIIKHTTKAGFDNQYPEIITITAISMILIITTISVLIHKKIKHNKTIKTNR